MADHWTRVILEASGLEARTESACGRPIGQDVSYSSEMGRAEMADDLEELGPIDYLVVEFPGSRMTGEGLPILVDLVDRGIIRILDLEFVKRELDGSVVGVTIRDFDHD